MICSCSVPLLLLFACFGSGLSGPASLVATATGIFLAWGPSGRRALEAGQTDVLLAALGMLAHAAMLIRFHRVPGLVSWLGVWLTAAMVWFCQPLVFPLALPLLLVFYLCVGARHGSFTWHASLFLAQAAALAVQFPWLVDWVSYWWLRSPLPASNSMLPHRTLQTLWDAPLWGGPLDRGLALVVLGSGLAGVVLLHYQQRLTARLLAMRNKGALRPGGPRFSGHFLGTHWPNGDLRLVFARSVVCRLAGRPCLDMDVRATNARTWCLGPAHPGMLARRTWVFVGYADRRGTGAKLVDRGLGTEPLQIGLGPVRELVVRKIAEHTGTDARILWEDRPLSRQAPRWSALLPILTGRTFLGGLDPDAFIEHSWISFIDGALEGRPIAAWHDDALQEYCKLYNVGWVIAWSPAVLKRFREWEGAVPVADLVDDVPGCIFLVKYAHRNYTLKGKAKMVHADWHHITLADVVPENGVVVLSLHYQAGMRASPSRVQIEREQCGDDPIGFIRLRVAGPVARVTLTWGNR